MQTALVPGSLSSLARQQGVSLAETFLNVDAIILLDVSGSMVATDARGGRSRFDIACEELTRLQATLPGKLAIIQFASFPIFRPNGLPTNPHGTTDLAAALKFVQVADVGDMRFIVVSDGEPDNEAEALKVAARYQGRIDTIYVGPEDGAGQEFLSRLARINKGKSVLAAQAHELAAHTERLLLGA